MTVRFRTHSNDFALGIYLTLFDGHFDIGFGWFSFEVSW